MKTTAELEDRIAELESAVAWIDFILRNTKKEFNLHPLANELRARAFPPKVEDVEVKRWECKTCGTMFKSQSVNDGNPCCWGADTLIPLTGTYQRPIVAKVKHREEIDPNKFGYTNAHIEWHEGARYFREWEA